MTRITPQNHYLGWSRDQPDSRDYMYSAPGGAAMPDGVDLRPTMPPVYDQGEIGSCTSNAIGAAIQFTRRKFNQPPDFVPSRLFVYYNERSIERTVLLDNGARLRDGIKSVANLGAPPETIWPYVATPADPDTNAFPSGSPPVTKPPAQAYTDALLHKAINYYRVNQTLAQLRGCLAEGFPFVFGFSVFSNIYDASGRPVITLNLPSWGDKFLGGHAILACGFDDTKNVFIIRNSWGSNSQDRGYFYMNYAYVTDPQLSSDFWTIRKESG